MQTQTFTLLYGIKHSDTLHREGELRLPTLMDVEAVLEQNPQGNLCAPHINRLIWGRSITRLGNIPPELIGELLETMVDADYGVILEAETILRKECLRTSGALAEAESGME